VLVDVTVQVSTREQQVSLIQSFEQVEQQLPHAVNNSQGAEVPQCGSATVIGSDIIIIAPPPSPPLTPPATPPPLPPTKAPTKAPTASPTAQSAADGTEARRPLPSPTCVLMSTSTTHLIAFACRTMTRAAATASSARPSQRAPTRSLSVA
jgi:hypothetical protein